MANCKVYYATTSNQIYNIEYNNFNGFISLKKTPVSMYYAQLRKKSNCTIKIIAKIKMCFNITFWGDWYTPAGLWIVLRVYWRPSEYPASQSTHTLLPSKNMSFLFLHFSASARVSYLNEYCNQYIINLSLYV